MAGLGGLLALLAVFAVSAEAQQTIRWWIAHRPEGKVASAEAFETKRRVRTATCGKRWIAASAAEIRKAAVAYTRPSNLPEIMRITRLYSSDGVPTDLAASGQPAPPDASGDGPSRGPLGLAAPPGPPTKTA